MAGGVFALRTLPNRRRQGAMAHNNPAPRAEHPERVGLKDAQSLLGSLITISQYMVELTTRAMTEMGERLTIAQFRTLVILEARGPMNLTHLAEELGVKPSTATRMLERLEARSLAVRGASPDDARTSVVLLTHKGRRAVARVHRKRAELLLDALRHIPDDEQLAVIDHLDMLIKASGAPHAAASELPPL